MRTLTRGQVSDARGSASSAEVSDVMSRDIQELERWIEKHPRLAFVYAVGAAILISELAFILDQLARRLH